jgi:hypothetical protein
MESAIRGYLTPKNIAVANKWARQAQAMYRAKKRLKSGTPARRSLFTTSGNYGRIILPNVRSGGFLGYEKKFIDTGRTGAIIASAVPGSEIDPNTVNCLNAVAQGDGPQNRDGRKYHILSVHIRGFINFIDETVPYTADHTRLLLVLDRQTNAAQLQAEDVLNNSAPATQAFRNLEFTQRFIVLKDFTLNKPQVGSGATTNTWRATKPFKINYTFKKPIAVTCSGTTGNVTAINDNSLHLIAITFNGGSNTLDYHARVRFVG